MIWFIWLKSSALIFNNNNSFDVKFRKCMWEGLIDFGRTKWYKVLAEIVRRPSLRILITYGAYTTPCMWEMTWKLGGGRFLTTLVWCGNSWDWGWVSPIFPGVLEEKPCIYIYKRMEIHPQKVHGMSKQM